MARYYTLGGVIIFVAIVITILVAITAAVTASICAWATDSKHKKVVTNMVNDYAEKTKKKEEVMKDANEKKNQVNNTDSIKSSYDASINILQDLSRKR